jgi:hypothetical protein
VAKRYQYAQSRFFYNQEFISLLLFNRTHLNLPKTKFINYNLAFQYYEQNRETLQIKYQDEEKTIQLPYEQIVNFIDNPDAQIKITGDIGEYQQSDEVIEVTQHAFDAFMKERPKTTNGGMLRMADWQADGKGNYATKLQTSHYFDEVRTALSLDFPLDTDIFQTMRINDLTDDGNLRSFSQSQLVNSIGVFTAVALYSEGDWFFHMMPRAKGLGVFSGMLSSVSGNVDPPTEPINDLVDYATQEIKREFHEETGLDPSELEKTGRCQVVPLAFTRELARGGKPQFFFLTVLHDVSQKEFAAAFKSAQWKSEFRSNMFANITSLNDVVSPEFSTCLFYSMAYIQKRRKFPSGALILP